MKNHYSKVRRKITDHRRMRTAVWMHYRTGTGSSAYVTCHYCQTQMTRSAYTVDHILRRKDGGSNDISNLVPACQTCNEGRELEERNKQWDERMDADSESGALDFLTVELEKSRK